MLILYSKKDLNYLIELYIQNKTIFTFTCKNKKIIKIINKTLIYLNYLGYVINNNYKIKIYAYKDKSKSIFKTKGVTKKI